MSNLEPRTGKPLIDATRPYAIEDVAVSWSHTLSTLAILAGCLAVAAAAPAWPLRLVGSVAAGLVVVRGFILFHDHMHGALLKESAPARALFWAYGVLVLTPPSVWRETHNYHHAHTAKIVGSHVGSYLTLTTDMWAKASPRQRAMYRAVRHPLTILLAYLTVFLNGMCVSPLLRNPRKHWDAVATLVFHLGLSAALVAGFGVTTWALVLALPLATACCLGGYLFYAQHNFPEMHLQPRERWTFTRAALESSSYMEMGPVLAWVTGNIGYHHVHHLNPTIPFYRLPEAMAGVPELQNPGRTSLRLRDVLACLRLKLWDAEAQRMVGFPEDEPRTT
jgi:omega-6 fatty acid desaturase (delta-12 desaturase)